MLGPPPGKAVAERPIPAAVRTGSLGAGVRDRPLLLCRLPLLLFAWRLDLPEPEIFLSKSIKKCRESAMQPVYMTRRVDSLDMVESQGE